MEDEIDVVNEAGFTAQSAERKILSLKFEIEGQGSPNLSL